MIDHQTLDPNSSSRDRHIRRKSTQLDPFKRLSGFALTLGEQTQQLAWPKVWLLAQSAAKPARNSLIQAPCLPVFV